LTKNAAAWWTPASDVDDREPELALVPLELVVENSHAAENAAGPPNGTSAAECVADEAALDALEDPVPLELRILTEPDEPGTVEGLAGELRRSAGRRLLVASGLMATAAASAVLLASALGAPHATTEPDAPPLRIEHAAHDMAASAVRIVHAEERTRIKRAARADARRAAAERRRRTIRRARRRARSTARARPSRPSLPSPAPPSPVVRTAPPPEPSLHRSQAAPAAPASDPATKELGIGPGS
jgi:hypothetical protein